jgi:hypothetical protein
MIVQAEFLNLLSIVAAASEQLVSLRKKGQHTSKDWRDFHQTADGNAVVVVVFTVTFLEAYVQNYASRRLGSAFSERLDRLDVVSKWLIVPRLVTFEKVNRDHPGVELLRGLVRARNAIVHSKSGGISTYEEMQGFAKASRSRRASTMLAAMNAPYCLRKLGEMLAALDAKEVVPQMLAQAFAAASRHRLQKRRRPAGA